MSEHNGPRQKFRNHLYIEIFLVTVLMAYLVLAQSQEVGADFAFTAVGAGLMVVVTCWTLQTLRDGLEWLANKASAA
ncbi:hypothetical protein [Marinobacter caseinilyticus]|uniref:hypothetical protein n=1 Tax=Marinobacter caseinilyticus TaxID=2692195 RepID=UPI00140C922C|nr:hypothetical protein [Marinobacter caseinilyticus]